MVKRKYHETIDWGEYWKAAKGDKVADNTPMAKYTVKPLLEFFEKKGVPDTYADVGCGLGSAVFSVAEKYPDTEVVGYDCIERILGLNHEKAVEKGYDNVSFEKADLPDFHPDRRFDMISSFFTLCYISDLKKMLNNLYDAVDPGGYLMITYHNEYAQNFFKKVAEDPEEYLDENASWRPEKFEERFELVLNGESLLSHRKIHDILGTWPQSVWDITEEADRYDAWEMNPLVFIPK